VPEAVINVLNEKRPGLARPFDTCSWLTSAGSTIVMNDMSVKAHHFSIMLFAALLVGCVSHEGTYSPACIAYVGSNITLSDGQFVWDKFTDEMVVNDAGEVVDQFPGYPMRGTYRINGQMVLMESEQGEEMEKMYLYRRDDQNYLYTLKQYEVLQASGTSPKCALVLGGNPDDR